jgi:phage terminase large subunit-like protein
MATIDERPSGPSLFEQLQGNEAAVAEVVQRLGVAGLEQLEYCWPFFARPNQLTPPGDWRAWVCLAGRGWGKTRTGAEFIRDEVAEGRMSRVALVAPTAADARDVMVEGESGLLAVCPEDCRPHYEPSKRRLTWPNGAVATTYSADEPDRLRGPQHDGAWCDELAAWRYPEAWDMLMFGLRLGDNPRTIVTTTPRPVRLVRELIAAPTSYVTRGSTYDNRANLADAFFEQIVSKYEGTTLGQQELYAMLLDDMPGALWTRATLSKTRADMPTRIARTIVGVDPAASSNSDSNATGIITACRCVDGDLYVFADDTLRGTPDEWARRVVSALDTHDACMVVAETNQGGEMVEAVLRTARANLPYKGVRASKGKRTRAEPIAALFEQGRAHIVGSLPDLEDELCSWVPDSGMVSPDRLDAMVWALTELNVNGNPRALPRVSPVNLPHMPM